MKIKEHDWSEYVFPLYKSNFYGAYRWTHTDGTKESVERAKLDFYLTESAPGVFTLNRIKNLPFNARLMKIYCPWDDTYELLKATSKNTLICTKCNPRAEKGKNNDNIK